VANVTRSQDFFSLFGFQEEARFRAGPARAMWLRDSYELNSSSRLELIEVPSDMPTKRADLSSLSNIAMTGLNHVAFDVTAKAELAGGLSQYLRQLNDASEQRFGKSVRLLVPPYQQIIDQEVVELAFVEDPDGTQIELFSFLETLVQPIEPAW